MLHHEDHMVKCIFFTWYNEKKNTTRTTT